MAGITEFHCVLCFEEFPVIGSISETYEKMEAAGWFDRGEPQCGVHNPHGLVCPDCIARGKKFEACDNYNPSYDLKLQEFLENEDKS